MKLENFLKGEELKDQLSYIVKQSKDSKNNMSILSEDMVEPASEVITKILDSYDEIVEELGEEQASSYGFNIMANYVMLSMHLAAINLILEKKLEKKDL